MAGIAGMPEDSSKDAGKRARAGLDLCQRHAAAALSPWYMQWQVCCPPKLCACEIKLLRTSLSSCLLALHTLRNKSWTL